MPAVKFAERGCDAGAMYSRERQYCRRVDSDSNTLTHHNAHVNCDGNEHSHRHTNPDWYVDELADYHADCNGDELAATISNVNVDGYEDPNGDDYEHAATLCHVNGDGYEQPHRDGLADGNRNRHGNQNTFKHRNADEYDITHDHADAHHHAHAQQHRNDDNDSNLDANSANGACHQRWSAIRLNYGDGDGNSEPESELVHQYF